METAVLLAVILVVMVVMLPVQVHVRVVVLDCAYKAVTAIVKIPI